ncbi:hypothetical protein JCM9534A_58370 [Catenuloplanes indicus JCM 9534]
MVPQAPRLPAPGRVEIGDELRHLLVGIEEAGYGEVGCGVQRLHPLPPRLVVGRDVREIPDPLRDPLGPARRGVAFLGCVSVMAQLSGPVRQAATGPS